MNQTVSHIPEAMRCRNPHFDDNLVVWDDAYAGRYAPPPEGYTRQFELQWRLAMERFGEYYAAPGVNLDDAYINDRIYEWTGVRSDGNGFHDPTGGVRVLDHSINVELIRGKRCIDVGCGMGRWTKTMLALGAHSVLSVDVSESALRSVRQSNPHVRALDILRIPEQAPDLLGAFDFACFWGVAMHTRDPLRAFLSAAATVKVGGAFYLMVYAPEGMHGQPLTLLQRKRFARIVDVEQKLDYVKHVHERQWDTSYPLRVNLRHLYRNLMRRPKGTIIGVLDTLSPFYNWVIPLPVIHQWMVRAGFNQTIFLNEYEPAKCAYHILGIKRGTTYS